MFLHIGENVAILKKDIVAIIDKKTIDESEDSKMFIKKKIDSNYLYTSDTDCIKTYILTCSCGEDKLYGSNISATTLFSRNKEINMGLEVKNSGQ